MPIFISYSEKDTAPYSSLCVALESEGLEYWNPKSMKSGVSLKDQLREAIYQCDVCIFIATRSSVESKWCLAETGAFWGADKRIILYVANPDIGEHKLPPLFQGDLRTCDVREVIRQVKEAIIEADKTRMTSIQSVKIGNIALTYKAFEIPPLHTHGGEIVDDSETLYGKAIKGELSTKREKGLLYGPYEMLPVTGAYSVVYRIKGFIKEGFDKRDGSPVIRLDIYNDNGEHTFSKRFLVWSEIKSTYRDYSLEFRYEDVSVPLEYRIALLRPCIEIWCERIRVIRTGI